MEYNELYHAGVKGMKWGVRRYQNKDGTLTDAGKKRYNDGGTAREKGSNSERNKRIAKRVAAAAIMTATVATAAALYAKNPKAVNDAISKIGNDTISGLKKAGNKTVDAGKKYVKEAVKGAKEGFQEGVREAPKKAVKAAITGMTMMAAKRMLDSTVGKEEAARIFQANNSKKISSFWKVSGEDKDDDD